MASKAILKRRRLIDHFVNICARSIISSQWHVISVENLNSSLLQTSYLNAPTNFKHIKDYERISLPKEESFNLSALGQHRQRCYEITRSVPSDCRLVLNTLIHSRCLSQSLHSFSTAAAKQPELGNDDEKSEEMVAKKRKEASPEECDQAVEGLSTAKAKAKAKRLQEPQKVVQKFLKRLWAVILGIGPAFRAVASMSRLGSFFCLASLA